MHFDDKPKSTKCHYDSANIISKYYCLYMLPFLFQNYNKNFNSNSIDACSKENTCQNHANKLKHYWNKELINESRRPSLLCAIIKCFGPLYLFTNLKNFIVYGVLRTLMPIILGRIIVHSNLYYEEINQINGKSQEFKNDNSRCDFFCNWLQLSNRQNVIAYSILLGTVYLLHVLISQPFYMSKFRYGMHIRVALTRLVYEKALELSNASIHEFTVGKIVNLMSTDVNQLDLAYHYWEMVYMALLETAVALFVMYQYIGRSCFGILLIAAGYIPFQAILANILSRYRSQSIALTDNRLRLMAEILPAIKVIKMYVYEQPFSNLVHVARKLEIDKIRKSMILRSINLALYFVSSKIMSFICILLFILDGGKLNAENLFVMLAIVSHIREILTLMFPLGISFSVETYISIKRIESFLIKNDISKFSLLSNSSENALNSDSKPAISLNNITVKSPDNSIILNNITIDFPPKQLTVVIGPVGSGKTSIFLAILNELLIDSGNITSTGKIAYVSQEAWIFSGTVRENILFGQPFDADKYQKIIKVAALSTDFNQLDNGDQTTVDDRGTSLSGGQRARISLARALYSDADCYLLDDPLSSVDAAVAKHIFTKCIKQFLKNKCVILVTHQLQFIEKADQIIVMKDGNCFAKGSYKELVEQGTDFCNFVVVKTNEVIKEPCKRSNSISSIISTQSSTNSLLKSDSDSILINCNASKQNDDFETANNFHKSTSKFKIYLIYIQAGASLILFSTFFLSNIITQILFTGSDYWLSVWTDFKENEHIHSNNPNFTIVKNPIIATGDKSNIAIYSILVLLLFIFSIIRSASYFTICMNSSIRLHNTIFSSLMEAPLGFFDKTSIGVILNRVSRDLGIIDDQLPLTAFESLEILCNSLGVFILCIAVNYIIVIPFTAMIVLIYLSSRFYVDTARRLKRLESIARSPLHSQMSSTLSGLPTIRSFQAQSMLLDQFSEAQDAHTATYYACLSASRLYGIFLELICVIYLYCLLLVLNLYIDSYTSSLIGLTISQSLQLTSAFEWGIRQFTVVETQMISVERVADFGQLDKEQLDKGKVVPLEGWPIKGQIEYENVSLIYGSDTGDAPKTVLDNINFHINGGEKIGIVGRTGAGKSSLIVTLFRLTRPTGTIRIDGIDTADISLAQLRKSLSIIPQEPVLFSGNIRRNLDTFSEATDEQLWDAIEKVQLKSKITSLDCQVTESDFSVGQKQLICLARAILRKSHILILDEATANVDPHTDSLIQSTIQNEFSQCTVLTIAHRLQTVIDYDRIMVLDRGSLIQFDTPESLIKQKSGIFYELVSHLNPETQNDLCNKVIVL